MTDTENNEWEFTFPWNQNTSSFSCYFSVYIDKSCLKIHHKLQLLFSHFVYFGTTPEWVIKQMVFTITFAILHTQSALSKEQIGISLAAISFWIMQKIHRRELLLASIFI